MSGKKQATRSKRSILKKSVAPEVPHEVQPKRGQGRPRKALLKDEAPVSPPSQGAASSVEVQPKKGPHKMPLVIPVTEEEASSSQVQEHDCEGNSKDDPLRRERSVEEDIQTEYLVYGEYDNIDVNKLEEALVQEERNTGGKNDVIKSVKLDSVHLSYSQIERLLICILRHTKVNALIIDGMEGGDDIAELIVKYGMCGEEKTLGKLTLQYIDVGSRGITALGKALAMSDCILKDLVLNKCHLDEEAVSQLALGLRQNTSLKCLTLGGYRFSADAAKAIGSMLVTNQSLKSLKLRLGNVSLCYLTEAIKQNTTLTQLCLVKTNLGRMQIDQLADVGVAKTSLSKIRLEKAEIGSTGVHRLKQMLKHPDNTIRFLEYKDCSLSCVLMNVRSKWPLG